jgi:hypothetical protein
MVPFMDTQENADLQGKRLNGSGSEPFGGSDGLVCVSCRRKKYCHNGGMARAHHHVGLARPRNGAGQRGVHDRHPWGSMIGTHGPHCGTPEVAALQGKDPSVPGADAFWGRT